MGGRGGASGMKPSDKVINFPGRGDNGNNSAPQRDKWDYREYTHAIDKLEKAVQTVRSQKTAAAIYKSLQSQDKLITAEMERNKAGTGDERVLMKERRRVRTLLRKIKSKEVL